MKTSRNQSLYKQEVNLPNIPSFAQTFSTFRNTEKTQKGQNNELNTQYFQKHIARMKQKNQIQKKTKNQPDPKTVEIYEMGKKFKQLKDGYCQNIKKIVKNQNQLNAYRQISRQEISKTQLKKEVHLQPKDFNMMQKIQKEIDNENDFRAYQQVQQEINSNQNYYSSRQAKNFCPKQKQVEIIDEKVSSGFNSFFNTFENKNQKKKESSFKFQFGPKRNSTIKFSQQKEDFESRSKPQVQYENKAINQENFMEIYLSELFQQNHEGIFQKYSYDQAKNILQKNNLLLK